MEFEATGHTYTMKGKEVSDALIKETRRQLPAQPAKRRAPVPTAFSQRRPISPLWPVELLNPEVGRRGRGKLKACQSRAKTSEFEVMGVEIPPDDVSDEEEERRIHCRALLRYGQRHHFVLTSTEMEAAAAAYATSETQRKVTRLERERHRRYNFLHATAALRPPLSLPRREQSSGSERGAGSAAFQQTPPRSTDPQASS